MMTTIPLNKTVLANPRFGKNDEGPLMVRLQKKLEADQAELAKQNPNQMLGRIYLQIPQIGDITGRDVLTLVDQLITEGQQKRDFARSNRSMFQKLMDSAQHYLTPFSEPQGVNLNTITGYFSGQENQFLELALRDLKRYRLIEQSLRRPARDVSDQQPFVRLTESGKALVTPEGHGALNKKRPLLERRLKQWAENFSEQWRISQTQPSLKDDVVKDLLQPKIKTAAGEFSYGDILAAIEQLSGQHGASEGQVMQYFQRNLEEEIQVEKVLLKLQQYRFITKHEEPLKAGMTVNSAFYRLTTEGEQALEKVSKDKSSR